MSFRDVIKKAVLENLVNQTMSVKQMVLLLCFSALVGIYIFFVYRYICKPGFYSKAFNVSLILMSIITTTIIITIQTSLVVSLGMVGALSIVRFRTAVKNPLDLVFTFWSISMGIVCGAGLPVIAGVMSLIITVILIVFFAFPEGKKIKLIHVTGEYKVEDVEKILRKYDKKMKKKSENYSSGKNNVLFEVDLKDTSELVKDVQSVLGVVAISIVDHQDQQF